MGRLEGKVAIITGAGRGIGRAIARRFAAEGAKVTVATVTQANVDALTTELNETHGAGTAIGVQCDVGELKDIKNVVAKTLEAFGQVDIAVNNAFELASGMHSTLDTTEDHFFRQMTTGPLAALRMMQEVYPLMEGRNGRILNFGSPASVEGFPGFAPYNMAKEAIRGLTRTAAREWGDKKITVNALMPVAFTESMKAAVEQGMASEEAGSPIPRMGDMEKDIAPVALFLCSEEAGYVTGYSFHADGGFKIDAGR